MSRTKEIEVYEVPQDQCIACGAQRAAASTDNAFMVGLMIGVSSQRYLLCHEHREDLFEMMRTKFGDERTQVIPPPGDVPTKPPHNVH